jgi:hypothetical protein
VKFRSAARLVGAPTTNNVLVHVSWTSSNSAKIARYVRRPFYLLFDVFFAPDRLDRFLQPELSMPLVWEILTVDESSILDSLMPRRAQVSDWPLGKPQTWAINPNLTRRCLPASGVNVFPSLRMKLPWRSLGCAHA